MKCKEPAIWWAFLSLLIKLYNMDTSCIAGAFSIPIIRAEPPYLFELYIEIMFVNIKVSIGPNIILN